MRVLQAAAAAAAAGVQRLAVKVNLQKTNELQGKQSGSATGQCNVVLLQAASVVLALTDTVSPVRTGKCHKSFTSK